jgi:hypothetical protein
MVDQNCRASRRYLFGRIGNSPIFQVGGIALILVVALGLRMVRLHRIGGQPLYTDGWGYRQLALEMSGPWDTGHREPLWVWLVYLTQRSVGSSPNKMRMLNIVLSLPMVVLVFLIGRRLYDPVVGLVGALLIAVHPHLLVFSVSGLREVLFWLLSLLLIYSCINRSPYRSMWEAVWIGTLSGLLCLVKLNGFTIAVPLVALRYLFLVRGQWRAFALAMVLMILIVSPHLAHNYRVGFDIFYSLNVHTQYVFPGGGATYFTHEFLGQWELGGIFRRTIRGTWEALFGSMALDALFSRQSLPFGLYLVPYGFYLLGLVLSLASRRWMGLFLLIILLGPYAVIVPSGKDPRYILQVYLVMALFEAYGFLWALEKTLGRRWVSFSN